MKVVKLRENFSVIVDDEDAHWLETYKYRPVEGYAGRGGRKGEPQTCLLHRGIIGAKKGEMVDHINRVRHDCRRENLRIVTASQNQQNRVVNSQGTKSRFKGVVDLQAPSKDRRGWQLKKRWAAQIFLNGRRIWLGTFRTEVEAARAYSEAAKQYFGEFARLNVLPEQEQAA